MKILPDSSRTYVECEYYPGTQLDPKLLFYCPSIARTLFKIDINNHMDELYTDNAENIAKAVNNVFGTI